MLSKRMLKRFEAGLKRLRLEWNVSTAYVCGVCGAPTSSTTLRHGVRVCDKCRREGR